MDSFGSGIINKYQKRYEEAIADFDQAIVLDPRSPVVYHYRGIAKSYLGRLEEAITDFKKAFDILISDLRNYNDSTRKIYESLLVNVSDFLSNIRTQLASKFNIN